jgi:Na+-driven multidrug efflux pump
MSVFFPSQDKLAAPPLGSFHIFKKKDKVGGVSFQVSATWITTCGASGVESAGGAACSAGFGIPTAGSGAFVQAAINNKKQSGSPFIGHILKHTAGILCRMSRPVGILRLTAPLIVSFWLRSAFAWVDTFYAAELGDMEPTPGLGDASIAAIGLALPFEFLMMSLWVGSSNGLTARLAAAMGAGEGAKVAQLKAACLRIILSLAAIAIVVASGIWWFADKVGLDPLVAQQFRIYGTVLIAGSAATSFWAILPDSLVKAHHDTRGTMWAGVLSGTTNVLLNTLFLFVFGWGILGIALSTVMGRIAGLSFALHRAHGHEQRRMTDSVDNQSILLAHPVRSILALAVPGALTYVFIAVESLAVNITLASGADSVSLLAAWSIFDRALRFLTMPMIAASVAMLPLAARYYGRRDWGSIRQEYRVLNRAGVLYVILFVVPFSWLAGPPLVAFLSDTPATQQASLAAFSFLPWTAFALLPFFCARSVFDGLQKPRPGLYNSAFRAIVLVVPLVMLGRHLAPRYGYALIEGVCGGFLLGVAIASLMLLGQLRKVWGTNSETSTPQTP